MRYTITIPSRDRHGEKLRLTDRTEAMEDAMRAIIEETGGLTAIEGKGYWTNTIGRLIAEDVTKLETYTEREHFRIKLMTIAERVKEKLDQESVAITKGGKIELI